MNKRHALIATALATACVAGLNVAHAADGADKEKCFGIAKSGQNDCASAAGSLAGAASYCELLKLENSELEPSSALASGAERENNLNAITTSPDSFR